MEHLTPQAIGAAMLFAAAIVFAIQPLLPWSEHYWRGRRGPWG